ncbi:TadE/TadG family type IV pilus assembly protein [Sphingomonas sp. RS6]
MTIIARLRHLVPDTDGTALLEFAFALPIFLTMSLAGAELTNYITTKMRIGQIALHLADNAARIGSGTQLQAKTISEADINDLFTGAQLQSGELDLKAHGRVILSDIEPMSVGATTYKIGWQRCYGDKTSYVPVYPGINQPITNMTGMGPAGRQTIAPDAGAAMFVEVHYEYTPLVKTAFSPSRQMVEIASMMVRDRRDLTQIYNNENVTGSLCD